MLLLIVYQLFVKLQFTTHNLLFSLSPAIDLCVQKQTKKGYVLPFFSQTLIPLHSQEVFSQHEIQKELTIPHYCTETSNRQENTRGMVFPPCGGEMSTEIQQISLMLRTFLCKATEDSIRISFLHLRCFAGSFPAEVTEL